MQVVQLIEGSPSEPVEPPTFNRREEGHDAATPDPDNAWDQDKVREATTGLSSSLAQFTERVLRSMHDQSREYREQHTTVSALVSMLYEASLENDEGRCPMVRLCLISRDKYSAFNKVETLRFGTIGRLKDPVPLSAAVLVRLGPATEHGASMLLVEGAERELLLWGIIDQQHRTRAYREFATSVSPDSIAYPEFAIEGVGRLAAIDHEKIVVQIRPSGITDEQVDPFDSAEFCEALAEGTRGLQTALNPRLGEQSERAPAVLFTKNLYQCTLRRILIAILGKRHGGALLISPTDADCLKPRFLVEYAGLHDAVHADACRRFATPTNTFSPSTDTGVESEATARQLANAIHCVSLFTRVDGAVCLDTDLRVRSFGTEVVAAANPKRLLEVQENSDGRSFTPAHPEEFGTRHRAAIRFCASLPGAVAFVVSEEGDVRAFLGVEPASDEPGDTPGTSPQHHRLADVWFWRSVPVLNLRRLPTVRSNPKAKARTDVLIEDES
jgi:DisA bacterial checkpoint controller nucleotide-binding